MSAECTFAELSALGTITLTAVIDGKTVILGQLSARNFSTGSYGLSLNGKIAIPVSGRAVRLQTSCNMTVIGSKPNGGAVQYAKPITVVGSGLVYIDDTSAGWIVGPFPTVVDAQSYQRTVAAGRLGKTGNIVAPGMAEYPAVAAAGAEAVDAKTASEQSVV